MDLIYRGQRYTAPTQSVQSQVGPQGGYYRGLVWYQRQVETVPKQPVMALNYRGIPYRTNGLGQAIAAVPTPSPSTVPAWTMGVRAIKGQAKGRTQTMTQVARQHHDTLVGLLERRMATARQQGNAELIKVLECERQQLA